MYSRQLRNSILQQAIQGKLVKQIAEEGTAKELLEKIRREREKLIKEGRIKQSRRDKELKPIAEDEIPFEIPGSWEWVRLGEICNLTNGEKYNNDCLLPYLEVKYLRTKINPKLINQGKFVKKNDYVILVDGENSGEYFKLFCDGILGSTFKKMIISDKLCVNYFFIILNINRELFKKNKKGSAIPHLDKDLFFNILLPLPPLQEQQRIVKKIETLEPFLKDFEENETKLNELEKNFPKQLKNSILQRAIQGKLVKQIAREGATKELLEEIKKEREKLIKEGKIKQTKKDKELKPIAEEEIPFEIPDSWEWVRLGEICNLTNGEKYDNDCLLPYLEVKYLRTKINPKLINQGKFVKKNDYVILVDGENSGEYFKLFCDGILGSTFKKMIISDKLCVNYFFIILNINRELFKKNKKGSAIPHLDKDLFFNILLPLPPLQEQQRIVEKVDRILEELGLMKN